MKLSFVSIGCFIFVLIQAFTIHAQQVGIKLATPQEALDVNGNIQLSGALKINGNAGINGQVLKSTGTSLEWGNLSSSAPFSRWQVFATPGNGFSWTIPAGVTEVMVEIWGGGGGGSSSVAGGGGGGGSGAYSTALINVSNVTNLSIYVGSGGDGRSLATGLAGSESEVRWTRFSVNYKIQSAGGLGAALDKGGAGAPVTNGATIVPSDISLFQLPGQSGSPVSSLFTRAGDGTYVRRVIGSAGGSSYLYEDYAKMGSTYGFDPTNSNTAASYFGSTSQNVVVAGMGGSSNRRNGNSGADGADGMVIIRW